MPTVTEVSVDHQSNRVALLSSEWLRHSNRQRVRLHVGRLEGGLVCWEERDANNELGITDLYRGSDTAQAASTFNQAAASALSEGFSTPRDAPAPAFDAADIARALAEADQHNRRTTPPRPDRPETKAGGLLYGDR